MAQRNVPLCIVRLLTFWYSNQLFGVRWGAIQSDCFKSTCGVRQGGILSPIIFNLYYDDLSVLLNSANIGCNFNGMSYNHFGYADDMPLISPSPSALQKLLKICEEYSIDFDIKYNCKKTWCMTIYRGNCAFNKVNRPLGAGNNIAF